MQADTSSQLDWCRRLYEATAAKLLLYGRALGLSYCEAEDVLQDTFKALVELGEPPAKPQHYCVRCFRNRALNHRRTLWRRLAREFESACWFERDSGTDSAEAAAMRCLADLPADQREVIVLKIWHGYTFEEIGGLLEISPNTAAGRHRYGLQKLRDRLHKLEYEPLERVGEPVGILETSAPVPQA